MNVMLTLAHAFDHTAHGYGNTIDFGQISFSHHRDVQG